MRSSSRDASASSRRSEIAEHGLAVLDRIALLAVDQGGQHVETLLDALEYLVGVGTGRRLVELLGDDRHLPGEPLDRLVGQPAARRDLVDALRQEVQALDHLDRRTIVDEFLDLPGKRGDARLDPLERLRIEIRRCRRSGRGHDRARDFVKALFDQVEGRAAMTVLLPCEVVDHAGERAHLFLERAQRQRFGKVVAPRG